MEKRIESGTAVGYAWDNYSTCKKEEIQWNNSLSLFFFSYLPQSFTSLSDPEANYEQPGTRHR